MVEEAEKYKGKIYDCYIYILHDTCSFFSAEDEAAASRINLQLHTPSSMINSQINLYHTLESYTYNLKS